MARITWTEQERALVVNTLASFLKENNKTIEAIHEPGWFAFYMQQSQEFLAEDRRRRITTLVTMPWFESMLRVAMGMPATPATQFIGSISAFVRDNLTAILAELQKTHVVVPKTDCVARPITRVQSKQAVKPKVLIWGTKPDQAAQLSSEFGYFLDLRFQHSDHQHKGTLPKVDQAIGMVGFMHHGADEILMSQYTKARYQRTSGGVDSVRKILNEIIDRKFTKTV